MAFQDKKREWIEIFFLRDRREVTRVRQWAIREMQPY